MLEDLVQHYVKIENQVMLAYGFGWAMGMINAFCLVVVAWKGHKNDRL